MQHFDDGIIADFLRRSYFAVDGLWFVRLEAEHSYNEALKLDEQVWRLMPKIQVKKARSLLSTQGGSLTDFIRCFSLKFTAEGYDYEVNQPAGSEVEVDVSACPWWAILKRSGREAMAKDISDAICRNEFAGFAKEFSEAISFDLEERICTGSRRCLLRFRVKEQVNQEE